MSEITPALTYQLLLFVQALHLLHHRFAKRHISYAEGISGAALCVPPTIGLPIPGILFMVTHGALIVVQLAGSIWINKLSPSWGSQ